MIFHKFLLLADISRINQGFQKNAFMNFHCNSKSMKEKPETNSETINKLFFKVLYFELILHILLIMDVSLNYKSL